MSQTSTGIDQLCPADRVAIGPRVPGGIYRSGYLQLEYRVEEVLTGQAARAVIPFSAFVLVESDLTGPQAGRRRVHCTTWDPRHDQVIATPDVEV